MPYRHISEDVRQAVVDAYVSGRTLARIRFTTGCSFVTIKSILGRANVEMHPPPKTIRTRTLREDAFSTITEESAYWTGFLMADGSVTKRKVASYSITLFLSLNDIGHVEEFKHFLGSDAPILQSRSEGFCGITTCARITVHSSQMGLDLARFGVVPNKSRDAKVNGLENNRHFWRGVMDGDGHLRMDQQGVHLELVGSKPLMNQFREFVGSTKTVEEHKSIARFRLNGIAALRTIFTLYGGCGVALPRKAETAQKCIADWMAPRHNRGCITATVSAADVMPAY